MKTYALRSIGLRQLLKWSGLLASSFYYKRSLMRKGIKPSTHSVNQEGELIENAVVVKDIEQTLSQEFCCCGYKNMTAELREQGWIINRKKVYRLMKEAKLLYGSRIRVAPFKRNFIKLPEKAFWLRPSDNRPVYWATKFCMPIPPSFCLS